jgi:hypothetical protein
MRREDYSKDEWGKILADRWDRLDELHKSGAIESHPLKDGWNADSKVLRAARDAAGSGLGARELEERDHGADEDPEDPTASTAGMDDDDSLECADPSTPGGNRAKGKTAKDRDDNMLKNPRGATEEAIEELRIRGSAPADLEGALHLARVKRINPSAVRAMDALIPGFNRIDRRGDTRIVDEDGIVQSPPRSR